jgi:hypothetical protein
VGIRYVECSLLPLPRIESRFLTCTARNVVAVPTAVPAHTKGYVLVKMSLFQWIFSNFPSGSRVAEKGGEPLINRFPLSLCLYPACFLGGGGVAATLHW